MPTALQVLAIDIASYPILWGEISINYGINGVDDTNAYHFFKREPVCKNRMRNVFTAVHHR